MKRVSTTYLGDIVYFGKEKYQIRWESSYKNYYAYYPYEEFMPL